MGDAIFVVVGRCAADARVALRLVIERDRSKKTKDWSPENTRPCPRFKVGPWLWHVIE